MISKVQNQKSAIIYCITIISKNIFINERNSSGIIKKISFTFIVLYILFSCNSPRNSGSNIANMYNESIESFIISKEKAFDDFIDNFEDYNFSTRMEARNEIVSRIDRLVSKYENDKASADYAY